MGVPKFFRYISERYPCLSELVKEYQIPEFDNLYLDMNGIIHMCSHPDDGNPHFRISEEKIFKDIFHYIEVLFRMIKPQKLFFMAVDGVAPRAKMNQQRGRRFRSAKDAEKQEADAIKKGEKLPEEARFDSNCITPGTVFMARLQDQLKYFVVDKISNDPMWQKCKVILSGHETPGEGEHKIMDYIRYMRAQPGYDPNTRHCLYGLDADLIMLGLCTHEPHFSLLREEVKFGKKSTKRMSVPEEITFFLLHLSLMREYLELEFAPLKDKLVGFTYDFEKIIDDWVLMGFLVGNDFIPHLPNLHIANGALPILYKAYMDILPSLNGYINESGTLNLQRFEMFMEKLGALDLENFEEIRDDLLYMESKTGRKYNAHSKVSTRNLEEWNSEEKDDDIHLECLEPEKAKDSGLAALIKQTDELAESDTDEETELSQSDEDEAFTNYKKEYYRNKLEYAKVTPDVLRDQAEGYVRAIQWNLNYYYNGCCSWSWYYPHHYAPYISDIKGFPNFKIEFDLGKPFLPYEQLLAVLPTASRNLLPNCYHDLMTEENSLIKKYYPEDFQTDLNGKKQDWEAVVLVPFIDENLLLEAMSYCNDKLTTEEKQRNSHGPMFVFMYNSRDGGPYPAPDYFPEIPHNHTEVKKVMYNEIMLPKEKLVKGAYPGVKMDVYYPGFPTMKHLKYKAEVKTAHIKVFETPSRNENMIITIIPDKKFCGDAIPVDLLGTTIFVGWPHLVEAKVTMISNAKKKFISMGGPTQYNVEEQTSLNLFNQQIQGTTEYYQKRLGINFGETKVLVHVQEMIGRKYIFTSNGRLTLDKQFSVNVSNYPLQTVVFNIAAYDTHGSVFKDIEEIFRKDSICFTLANPYYGSQGVVQDSSQTKKTGRVKICVSVLDEPDFKGIREMYDKTAKSYKTSYSIASRLSIPNVLFSRITGSIFVSVRKNSGELKSVNIGLDLKMNKKNKETPGYTRKSGNTWYYTDKSAELVRSYFQEFPEVFHHLCNDTSFENIRVETLFGEDYETRMDQLKCWLRSLPVHSVERQTCGSAIVEPEIVAEIERTMDNFKCDNVKKVTMSVKPNLLYRPEIQSGTLMPDPKTNTRILDRVVNVRLGFSVPFGLKGTVIGIQEANTKSERDIMYDIVFDKSFKDGMQLNCSEGRGYRLPKTSFINISYGQRLIEDKNGKSDAVEPYGASKEFSTKPQPSYIQQWFVPQQEPYQPPTFNQPNSAFAQFSGIMQRKAPSDDQPQEGVSNKEPENMQPQGLKDVLNRLQQDIKKEKERNQQHQRVEHMERSRNEHDSFSNANQFNDTRKQESRQWYNKPFQDFSKQNSSPQNDFNYNRYNRDGPQHPQQPQWRDDKRRFQRSGSENDHQQQWHGDRRRVQRSDREKVIPSTNNYFMPNYREHTEEQKEKPNVRIEKPPASNRIDSNESLKRTHTVNTDYLKDILKIGSDANEKNENKKNTPAIITKNVTENIESSNVSFEMLATVADAPASIRLLTYYQSNGLGLPRYQYLNTNASMTQAQIILPDGKLIIGGPAPNKEAASENVASNVLEFLMKKLDINTESSKNIPSPPKDWVYQDNGQTKGQNGKSPSANPRDHKQPNKKKSETAEVWNNSFVPLQAIKSHISKTSNKQTEESIKENLKTQGNRVNPAHKDEKGSSSSKGHQSRPKKERKPRIAANFLNKN
ncbi:hypothetical protein JTB14_032690 [Gonioctena quinquepunctata]|nr:hypothetical protein JTB14_032690 [Gonioctena quinquepunctata]